MRFPFVTPSEVEEPPLWTVATEILRRVRGGVAIGWSLCVGVGVTLQLVCVFLLTATASAQSDPPVASWAGYELSQSVFADAYRAWISRVPTPDSPQARATFAGEQLERLIIAERADLDAESLAGVQRYVARERERTMRAAYFRSAIGDTIPRPTGAEIRASWRRSQTQIQAQQVFSPDPSEIVRWNAELEAGADFDSLAALSAAQYGGDPSGLLGIVTGGDLGLGPETALFDLAQGERTQPVASLNGWHVLRVLDRTETVRVDGSAFDAARERVAAELFARRFDEATTRMLRERLSATPLTIDVRVLRALWPLVAPAAQAQTAAQIRLLDELASAVLPDVSPDAVVATFGDGQTLTARAFVDALPSVESEALRPDLRGAAETVVRDWLVTGWARDAGMEADPMVNLRAVSACLAARYTSAIGAVADTLSPTYTEPLTYDLLRDNLFVRERGYAARVWTFADADAARAALDQDRSTWPAAERVTLSDTLGLPLGTLAQRAGEAAGPFEIGEQWALIAVDRADVTYEPRAAVADEVAMRALGLRPFWAHRLLLPAAYDPGDVVLDASALAGALPRYDVPTP